MIVMKKLLLILVLFFSTKALSADTDVYYCVMNIWVETNDTNKLDRWSVEDEKFTFHLSKNRPDDRVRLKWGEESYKYFPTNQIFGEFVNNIFMGYNIFQIISLDPDGKFIYTSNWSSFSKLITATCSKF